MQGDGSTDESADESADRAAGHPAPRGWLADRLERLLHLAGPVEGRVLLDRLEADLVQAEAALTAALAAGDRAAIRAQTHILISVAGSVGATGLEADARRLNLAAQAPAEALPAALGATIGEDLGRLIALVRARIAGTGGAT